MLTFDGLSRAMLICSLIMSAGAFAIAQPPQPGMLNSFTGDVRMNGVPVGPIGAGRITLDIGRTIRTGEGMAELLLTPGSFLRLGDHSEFTLEASRRPRVRARILKGEALLEVLDLQTPIVLEQNGVIVVIRKPGLYDFNQKGAVMAVYDGEAQLSRNDKQVIARKGFAVRIRNLHEFPANPDPGSTLFSWSSIRSEQLSSESAAFAQAYSGGTGEWPAPGWYRNPWSPSYTWLSASGSVTGPFGWPYYSPGYAPNYIPPHPGGDFYLYGPPVLLIPGPVQTPVPGGATPSVPLTAPGVPRFPNHRF